ncbi:MAG: ribosomal L7Ae/L30e/S12e/Gadd45 family protein [Clostridia bacterium]|nr:ribosomal L7Ae/L30e/S12e/Gadd45 family protein [Clostridia bacterium]
MSEKELKTEEKPFEGLHVLRAGSEKKLLGLLGFAARARKLVCGTDLCRDAIRRGQVPLVLIAADASANTKKRIIDACKYYDNDLCVLTIGSAELSRQIGKTANIAVVGLTDMNFIHGISALFDGNNH